MPIIDYVCTKGHVEQDVYYTNRDGGADQTRECPECGAESAISFGTFGPFNARMSTASVKRGIDPQTGVEYENAVHRDKVWKEMGLVPADDVMSKGRAEAEAWDARNRDMEQKSKRKTSQVIRLDEMDVGKDLSSGFSFDGEADDE